jgi:hypothetical protein
MSERLTSFSEILAPLERTKESSSMSQKKISGGVVHQVPADLKKALTSDPQALTAWEDITPLARNEWICCIESAKKAETRSRRIEWGCSTLRMENDAPLVGPDALTANFKMNKRDTATAHRIGQCPVRSSLDPHIPDKVKVRSV